MHGKNPIQVQFAPKGQRQKQAPLVLIHDGGGTTFGYFILKDLHRDVWAIHNPNFLTGKPWDGGIDEMARNYVDLLHKSGITGEIVLGGWSLGGYLALTMAHLLASQPQPLSSTIKAIGLILIDSPYHIPTDQLETAYCDPDIKGLPDLVKTSFGHCTDMLRDWELPHWDGPACGGRGVTFTAADNKHSLRSGQTLHEPLEDAGYVIDNAPLLVATLSPRAVTPPPAVLVRCANHAPGAEQAQEGEPCHVDLFRDEPLLGWDRNYPDFVKAVFETDSHHYEMFEFSQIANTTDAVISSLEVLDSLKVCDV